MKSMKQESSLKILFLLNLLCSGEFSKNEIIEKFKNNNVEIKKTSINNYIDKLKQYDIPITTKKIKNVNYYSLEKKYNVTLKQNELDCANDVKKLILSEKNQEIIKNTIRVFCKFALFANDNDTKLELADFGYYSKINWLLVKQLKEHCKNKNIITISYILPNSEKKNLTIHTDMIKMSDWSERLYLSGILEGDNKISQLPVDKISKIKKVVKENVKINLEVPVLTYKISKEMYEKIGVDKKEGLSEIKNNIATIRRPIDDTFFTIQRLLYFCPDLYYISNEKIKNLVKEKLYTLKDMYSEEFDK